MTCGTDRKVAYWEAFDGTLIRELEASQSDTINGLDISPDGSFFVIGGSDKLVKVFNLNLIPRYIVMKKVMLRMLELAIQLTLLT